MHKALGRGLESLIPVSASQAAAHGDAVTTIPIEKIRPNRYQPRVNFNESKLKELSDSIKQHGLAQPLLVAPSAVPGEYELIAGERRWRASQMAGLKEVTVVVRSVGDKERFQLSLIENIQRENLNPIEEARGYKRLGDEFHHTQEELAQVLGKDRSVIANSVRLLNLPTEIQDAISAGMMSPGHGRILAGIEDGDKQKLLAERILREKLTVREIEKIVADWKSVLAARSGKKKTKKQEVELVALAEELQRQLGTKVRITGKSKKGKIEIHYFSLSELERLAAYFKARKHK
ncbi:MAG: ParB/RepB/Spo0J family partition protein [Endomicrobiales bacterium]